VGPVKRKDKKAKRFFGNIWREGEVWQLGGHIRDRILRGTKPADLPIQQPTKYEQQRGFL
jgi:hypothetical protein